MLEAIATHMALHGMRGGSIGGRMPSAGMAGMPQQGGLAGIIGNMTGSPLGQIGTALLAGGGGPLGNAAAMLAQQGMYSRLAQQQAMIAMQPRLEHIGNQVGFIDPRSGQFTPTYTEPQQPDELTRHIRAAGIDPESPEGRQAYANALDPIVNIPLPGGQAYVGPRSGLQDALQRLSQPQSAPGSLAPPAASTAAPAGSAVPAVAQVESNGRDLTANGTPTVSSKGAMYAMQVLPSTAHNPGFGVTPAQSDTPAEYDRVGRDYLSALQRHYNGSLPDALAAYNAGPGTVDKALASGSPLPSQGYVNNVMSRMGTPSGGDLVTQAQQAIAAGADPAAVRARALQMGVTLP